jgi:hypothetical protein
MGKHLSGRRGCVDLIEITHEPRRETITWGVFCLSGCPSLRKELNAKAFSRTIEGVGAGRMVAAPKIGEERKVRTPEGRVVANGNSPTFWDMESATERKPPREG